MKVKNIIKIYKICHAIWNYLINFYHYLLILGELGIALIFGSELLNGYLAAQDNDHKVAVSLVASDTVLDFDGSSVFSSRKLFPAIFFQFFQ